MIKVAYSDYNELELSKEVLMSLGDRAELAHIRAIEDEIFVIVTYPNNADDLRPVCIKVNDHGSTIYYDQAIDMSKITDTTSFTEFITVVLDRFEDILEVISDELDLFESNIDQGLNKEDIRHYFLLNKKLINFETAISAIEELINYISGEKVEKLWCERTSSDYANMKIEIKQLNQNIEMYLKIINSIINVSDSLFSSKLNITMKRLTTVTLVLALPTFVTSFYGMNINLPFQEHPYSLQIVFLISFILTGLTCIYLYKNDYF